MKNSINNFDEDFHSPDLMEFIDPDNRTCDTCAHHGTKPISHQGRMYYACERNALDGLAEDAGGHQLILTTTASSCIGLSDLWEPSKNFLDDVASSIRETYTPSGKPYSQAEINGVVAGRDFPASLCV